MPTLSKCAYPLQPLPQNIVSPSRPRQRATKIVATIGPATRDAAAMAQLLEAGVNVARFNVKHNTKVCAAPQPVSRATRTPAALVTAGPSLDTFLRVGPLPIRNLERGSACPF